jgi:hypothetical protein
MIFVLALGALAFGGFVILLIARYAPHPNANIAATQRVVAGGNPMPYDDFRALVVDILDALKLEIVLLTGSSSMLEILVRSNEPLTSGRYLVHAVWEVPGDVVDQPWVIRLQDSVRADSCAKGILLTPYTILTDGLGNLEVPIELVDGRALRELVEKYLPAQRLDQLAKYRGFGL